MRIESKPGASIASIANARRRADGSGFSVSESAEGGAAAGPRAASVGPTTSLDAILALQGEPDPEERRRRAAQRGRELLDGLDRLKAAILSGRVAPDDLAQIARRLGERREATGDPRLDEILAQIELRAEVEIAKLSAREGRAAGDRDS
ncbi:flagellar assembly protein FliX [Salinarimonas sp.]|uniref:flagellar assembly protein FliX n=1 Tax=Salinarimonas sp. TaxID=2766526 RepID=UPI0032D8D1C8